MAEKRKNKKEEKPFLPLRQKRFCDLYLTDQHSNKKAAELAGYSKKSARISANVLLKKPHIQKYINMTLQETAEKLGVTTEWKLKMLKRCATRSMPDHENERGTEVNASGVIGAIAEINKMVGDYAPSKSVNAHLVGEGADEVKEIMKKYERDY